MNKVVVVRLGRSQLEVVAVQGEDKIAAAETQWDPENLQEKLKLVKEKFECESVRVLLSDEIAYTMVKEIAGDEKVDREELEKEVEKEFPDAVGGGWDYRIEEEEGKRVALIFAPVKAVFDVLSAAAIASGLVIEDVEPESFAKRRGEDAIISIAKKGLRESGEETLNMEVEVVDDKQGLGMESVGETERFMRVAKKPFRINFNLKWLWIGLATLLVVGVVVGGVLRVRSVEKKPDVPEVVAPVPSITPTPTPTPEPVDLSVLTVQVLNGSGVVGEAGRVKVLLTEAGFEEDKVETANAKNYDYLETEVRIKQGLADGLYVQLKELLSGDYTVSEEAVLPISAEFDIQIIVGTREGVVQGVSETATPVASPNIPSASPSASPASAVEATEAAQAE